MIEAIVRDCLAKDNSTNTKEVCGLAYKLVLDLDKLENYRETISTLLDNTIKEGESISSIYMGVDDDGNRWCSYYEGELLIILGKGLDILESINLAKDMPLIFRKPNDKKLVKGI